MAGRGEVDKLMLDSGVEKTGISGTWEVCSLRFLFGGMTHPLAVVMIQMGEIELNSRLLSAVPLQEAALIGAGIDEETCIALIRLSRGEGKPPQEEVPKVSVTSQHAATCLKGSRRTTITIGKPDSK